MTKDTIENIIGAVPYAGVGIGIIYLLSLSANVILYVLGVTFFAGILYSLFVGWDAGWGKYSPIKVKKTKK